MRRPDTKPLSRFSAILLGGWLMAMAAPALAGDGWRTLTAPQPLPAPEATGNVEVGGATIHYAIYGSGNAEPVLLLHGGLGAAED